MNLKGLRARAELSSIELALDVAIRKAIQQGLTGEKIIVEGDPLYGVKKHRRRYPKSGIVDADILAGLAAARLRWLRSKVRTNGINSSKPVRQLISLAQAQEILEVSKRTLYHWMNRGQLEYYQTPGGTRRIYLDSLVKGKHGKTLSDEELEAIWSSE